jgi:hypothetical protein
MNRVNAIDTDIRGYLSQEHKRKFTITAGILGAVFFIVQFIVPFVVMMAAMPFMVFSLKMAEPQRGAYWNNAIWYIEKAVGTGTASDNPTMLKKIKPSSKDGPEDICELSIENPWLLAGENRLWIIASSAVGYYQDDDLVFVSKAIQLGDISRPFLY